MADNKNGSGCVGSPTGNQDELMTGLQNGNVGSIQSATPSLQRDSDPDADPDLMTIDEQEKKKRYRQDTEFRKKFSNWVIWVDSVYLFVILVIVILYGCGLFKEMNSTVMVTLLGTTTANVLGLAAIILNGLFKVKEV